MAGPKVTRALETVLDGLHGLVAHALTTELKQHLALLEASAGSDEPYQIPPQFLDKVLKFLASNGVNAPQAAPRVDALVRQLQDLDLDAEAARPN